MTDIAEIFARDPLSLTKSGPEIKSVIEYYRGKRAQYLEGDKKAGAPIKPKAEKKTKAAAPSISIDELDL